VDVDVDRIGPSVVLDAVYRDAWRIYRLLFRRSVLTAAIVFAVLAGVNVANDFPSGRSSFGLRTLGFVLSFAAPVVVQGALVEIVRNIHEGRAAKGIGALYERARARFWSLIGASLLYSFGIVFGLLLLVVPGLFAAARWALMAPFIVLEGHDAGSALDASSFTVRPQTGRVMAVVVLTFLLTAGPSSLAFWFLPGGDVAQDVFSFAWSSLTAPFSAHVLTVLYYRLTDPERPVIHEDVVRWRSVWEGA
jgi:hypothetical protein